MICGLLSSCQVAVSRALTVNFTLYIVILCICLFCLLLRRINVFIMCKWLGLVCTQRLNCPAFDPPHLSKHLLGFGRPVNFDPWAESWHAGYSYSGESSHKFGLLCASPYRQTDKRTNWKDGRMRRVMRSTSIAAYNDRDFRNLVNRLTVEAVVVRRKSDGRRCCLVFASSTVWCRSDETSVLSAGTSRMSSTKVISGSACDRCRSVI